MKRKFLLSLMAVFLVFSVNLFSEVKKIEITVKQPFGGSQSPDDARIAAITKAKREALERAGTYIESLTIVKEGKLQKDEILAIAAGVLKVKIVSQKNYATEDSFGIIVKAEVKVDTSVLEERVRKLLKDKKLLEKYKELEKRERELLARIRELEEENRRLKSEVSSKEKERLKKEFREVSRKLTATELNKKALALWDNGYFKDPDNAIEYLKEAIEKDPEYADAYNNLGVAYADKGSYDRAIYYFEKALKIYLSKLGKDQPSVAMTYFNMGFLYISKKDFPKAKKNFEKAYSIFSKTLGENHPYTQRAKNMLKKLKEVLK